MHILRNILWLVEIFVFLSCTNNVSQISPHTKPQSIVGMGFVGYTLEESEGAEVYLTVQSTKTKDRFKVLLNNHQQDKQRFYLGPWKLIDNYKENVYSNDVMLSPLLPGKYAIIAFSMKYKDSKNNTGHNYPTSGGSFDIIQNKVTYIGSYSLDSKYLLPWKRNVKTVDLSKKYLSKYKPESYSIQITNVSNNTLESK